MLIRDVLILLGFGAFLGIFFWLLTWFGRFITMKLIWLPGLLTLVAIDLAFYRAGDPFPTTLGGYEGWIAFAIRGIAFLIGAIYVLAVLKKFGDEQRESSRRWAELMKHFDDE